MIVRKNTTIRIAVNDHELAEIVKVIRPYNQFTFGINRGNSVEITTLTDDEYKPRYIIHKYWDTETGKFSYLIRVAKRIDSVITQTYPLNATVAGRNMRVGNTVERYGFDSLKSMLEYFDNYLNKRYA